MSDQATNSTGVHGFRVPWLAMGLAFGAILGDSAGSLAWGLGVGAAIGLALQLAHGRKELARR